MSAELVVFLVALDPVIGGARRPGSSRSEVGHHVLDVVDEFVVGQFSPRVAAVS